MTAEELLEEYESFTCTDYNKGIDETHYYSDNVKDAMIEFAKFHVEKALKEANKSWKKDYQNPNILNSYNLDNIK